MKITKLNEKTTLITETWEDKYYELLKSTTDFTKYHAQIYEKLKELKKNYKSLMKAHQKLHREIQNFDIQIFDKTGNKEYKINKKRFGDGLIQIFIKEE